MRNIKLILEYDGTAYSGWQSQTNAVAIQDILKKAVQTMTEEEISLMGASRTDAGVHALGQVAAFKTTRAISCESFLKGLNSLLPKDIRVKNCEEVSLTFHPLKNAKWKRYLYRIELEKIPSAILRNFVAWIPQTLDITAMQEASQFLIGRHDFKSFQGADASVKTTVRNLQKIEIAEKNNFLELIFVGDGFLKQMVRNIVGTLIDIGLKKYPPARMQEILEGLDRKLAGPTAPPQGLYLVEVDYAAGSPPGGGTGGFAGGAAGSAGSSAGGS